MRGHPCEKHQGPERRTDLPLQRKGSRTERTGERGPLTLVSPSSTPSLPVVFLTGASQPPLRRKREVGPFGRRRVGRSSSEKRWGGAVPHRRHRRKLTFITSEGKIGPSPPPLQNRFPPKNLLSPGVRQLKDRGQLV